MFCFKAEESSGECSLTGRYSLWSIEITGGEDERSK